MSDKPLVIALEGNIGAGKTTVLQHLEHYPQVTIFKEQVSKWQCVPGLQPGSDANILHQFYHEPKRYAYTFQTYAQLTQFQNHIQVVKTPIKILERSIHTAFNVFASLLHDEESLTSLEYALLQEHYRHYCELDKTHVDYYLMLDTPPVAAFQRLQKRGRSEEKQAPVLTIEYLERLDAKYEEFLNLQSMPVLRVSGLQDTGSVLNEIATKFKSICSHFD
jgi:deoxyadenosine/deoxycytidine kinase